MDQIHSDEERRRGSASSARPIEDLLSEFDRHLDRHRGCVAAWRINYQREARSFLVRVFPTAPIRWELVSAEKVAE